MKPPPRKRSRVIREAVAPDKGRWACKWPYKEKMQLAQALRKLRPKEGSTEPLDPERVREHLPTRTASEINSVLEALTEKVISFAKNTHRLERREERRAKRPLGWWIQEARFTEDIEDSLSTALSRMLAVSSLEARTQPPVPPASKSSSPASRVPPRVTQPSGDIVAPSAHAPPVTESTPCSTPTSSLHPVAPGTPPQAPRERPDLHPHSPLTQVSFERIYSYLGALHQPTAPFMLTPMESAIVLDLLMSLPEEMQLLDSVELRQHLSQVYLQLSPKADSGKKGTTRDPSEDPDCQAPAGVASTQGSADTKHSPLLNPFRIPVSLLSRKAATNPSESSNT